MANSGKTKFELAIAQKVASIRHERGLSQKEVADLLGVSIGFIGQIESTNSPSIYSVNHLNKLAFELGCSPQDFIPNKPIEEKDWE
jgi:transcriptional regulator with XRE-family HTH domain